MSDAPGSGKSTLAKLLGSSIYAVVIDHDVLKSSLLEYNTVSFDQASKFAYPSTHYPHQPRHFIQPNDP